MATVPSGIVTVLLTPFSEDKLAFSKLHWNIQISGLKSYEADEIKARHTDWVKGNEEKGDLVFILEPGWTIQETRRLSVALSWGTKYLTRLNELGYKVASSNIFPDGSGDLCRILWTFQS